MYIYIHSRVRAGCLLFWFEAVVAGISVLSVYSISNHGVAMLTDYLPSSERANAKTFAPQSDYSILSMNKVSSLVTTPLYSALLCSTLLYSPLLQPCRREVYTLLT